MRLSKNNLFARADHLEKLIERKKGELGRPVDGKLIVGSSHGKDQFFLESCDGQKKYLSKNEMSLIKSIAQKEYDQKVLAVAESELTTLKVLLKKYDNGTAEDIFDKLAPARQRIVEPIMLSNDEFIRRWLDEPYDQAGFAPGEPEFLTSKGLRVRSKSEIIFADKYDEYGIPFKYECPLQLDGFGQVRPDFKTLNVRLRRVIYHEHLGMMDDPDYAERNIRKIRAYERNGFVIGRDLILTFETRNNPVGPADADRLIRTYFQ